MLDVRQVPLQQIPTKLQTPLTFTFFSHEWRRSSLASLLSILHAILFVSLPFSSFCYETYNNSSLVIPRRITLLLLSLSRSHFLSLSPFRKMLLPIILSSASAFLPSPQCLSIFNRRIRRMPRSTTVFTPCSHCLCLPCKDEKRHGIEKHTHGDHFSPLFDYACKA